MKIRLKRAYEPASKDDGFRILVERLWPRGVSKDSARIDLWAKDVAPSTELRRWFAHEPSKWEEFRTRYLGELREREDAVAEIEAAAGRGLVTFVYGSREERLNSAQALKDYVEGRRAGRRGRS